MKALNPSCRRTVISKQPVIAWFRQDLRITDNPALTAAARAGLVVPVYILDDINSAPWQQGGASRWWLHHALQALNTDLQNSLLVLRGDPLELLPALADRLKVQAVYWNRCYEPWRIKRDTRLKSLLTEQRVNCHSYNGLLLWEPWQILKQDQTPYQVFTPYYRNGCLQAEAPGLPLPAPESLQVRPLKDGTGKAGIDALSLLPRIPWDKGFQTTWVPGENGAQQQLATFLDEGLQGYKEGRNFPDRPHVSRLSPRLHFGEISPRQVWDQARATAAVKALENDLDCFLSELGWREFSYYLLYHKPDLPVVNIQSKFDAFPWRDSPADLKAWQQGMTGYPLIDAGMRELWQTGYMHNRVRMVTASFLIKNLRLHWHLGEQWFWDCLVDADLASNSASWQWVAGCGADAAPYFRIFNPVTQSQKFDPAGNYIRRYVPELASLPDKHLHNPAAAPAAVLEEAGLKLGQDYPLPIVDLKESREAALAAFKAL